MAATTSDSISEPEIVGEVVSKRGESVKHFRMSDGSFTAISYGFPVHYRDVNGELCDINNTPVMAADAGMNTYRVANSDNSLIFGSTLTDGRLLTTSYKDMSVSMTLFDRKVALFATDNELYMLCGYLER